MTNDDKALVERLEAWEWALRAVYKAGDLGTDEPAIVMGEAADRIEALSAENERLREALGFAIRTLEEDMEEYNYRHDGPTLTILRAALGEQQ